MNTRQRRWLGMVLVAAILFLIVWHFHGTKDWQQFHWRNVWSLLIHAQPSWLLAALAATYATYLLRAYRWKFFMDPFKPGSSVRVLFVAQILGFSAIYLIGRPGELVRPAYIARWERVPFASQVAIWLLERIYDTVAVSVLLALGLYFEPIRPKGAYATLALRRMHTGAFSVLAGTLIVVAALIAYRQYSDRLIGWGSRTFRFLPLAVRTWLGSLARSFAEGLDVIRNWRDLGASVLCTMILWILNVSTFWFVYKSLGGSLSELSWWVAAVTLVFAAMGLALQLPGVGGGYQVGAMLALEQIFHVPAAAATSAAVLEWILVLVPCVALALVLLIYEGLTFRKLQAMAEAERLAVAHSGTAGAVGGGS
jgi:uncharacterized protein (TIRG00374 family)